MPFPRNFRFHVSILDRAASSAKGLYSSRTWVTLFRLAGIASGEVSEELGRSERAEGLMRPDGVGGMFARPRALIESGGRPGEVVDFVELFGVGALGAFDGAIEFGGAGRQGEQANATLLTGQLELGGELGAAVDLDGAARNRHTRLHGVQEARSRPGGGAVGHFEDIPARDHIAGREMRAHGAGQWPHIEGVELNAIAGLLRLILAGFAPGIGAQRPALVG
jgi:hypothetical protein